MKNNSIKIFRLIIMFVLAFLLISSVVSAEQMKSIKKDKISSKAQSVVFGRVRIVFCPGFSPSGKSCKLYLWDYASKRLPSVTFSANSSYRIKSEEESGYDIPFYAEAQTGGYIFGYCGLEIQNYLLSDIESTANFIGNGSLTGVGFNILKACKIPADSLVYLGVIEIKMDRIYFEDNKVKTDETTNIIFDDYENDLKNFQTDFPQLYERFKDNIVMANWVNLKNKSEDTSGE